MRLATNRSNKPVVSGRERGRGLKWTYAFGKVGAGEVAVAREAVEVSLDLDPGVASLVAAADESESADRALRAGLGAVELRAAAALCAGLERGVDARGRRRGGGGGRRRVREVGAALCAREALGEVLRELLGAVGGSLELLRELQQAVRGGPAHRGRARPRRRPGRRRGRVRVAARRSRHRGGARRCRLDAPQHNVVVLEEVQRDLDQLLPVVGAPVGAARRGARAQRPRRRGAGPPSRAPRRADARPSSSSSSHRTTLPCPAVLLTSRPLLLEAMKPPPPNSLWRFGRERERERERERARKRYSSRNSPSRRDLKRGSS